MDIDGMQAAARPIGLANQLKTATWSLHREAERSGVLQDLLRGRAGRDAYALLLRNLLPAYETLERELDRARATLGGIAEPDLYRAAAIRADLDHIAGSAWVQTVPLLPSATAYALRIDAAAASDPLLLIPHAYVRYLGDLNGGQILKRLLGASLGLGAAGLAVYDFPAIHDPRLFAEAYRSTIDGMMAGIPDVEPVLAEASTAFHLNIAVSHAVKDMSDAVAASRTDVPITRETRTR